jgi:arsenate reductase
MNKSKAAFICVHNSCRSQIAEALGILLASDVFQSFSAGTETKPQINQDAIKYMKIIKRYIAKMCEDFLKWHSDNQNEFE